MSILADFAQQHPFGVGTALIGLTAVTGVYQAYKYASRQKTEDVTEQIFKKLWITDWVLYGHGRVSKGPNSKRSQDQLRPIFNEETERNINKVRQMILNSKNSGCKARLPNLIIIGLPGVGKTMLAEALCHQTGIGYIRIPPNALQMSPHSTALHEVFRVADEFSNESGIPTMIIMDDGEKMVEQRPDEVVITKEETIPGAYWIPELRRLSDTMADSRVANVNTILDKSGAEISNIAFAVTSNRPKVIDRAFRTRANEIRIDPPGLEERKKIIAYHLPKVFNKDEKLMCYFNIRTITDMAIKTEGFTGRNLVKLLEEINACAETCNGDLTDDIINACILTVAPAANFKNLKLVDTFVDVHTVELPQSVKDDDENPVVVKVTKQVVTTDANSLVQQNNRIQAKTIASYVREFFEMVATSFAALRC